MDRRFLAALLTVVIFGAAEAQVGISEEEPVVEAPSDTASADSSSGQQTSSEGTEDEPAATVSGGTIVVTSTPTGASVVVNDVTVGTSPYRATGFLPGLYEVRVRLDDHEEVSKMIRLTEDGADSVHASLKYKLSRITVLSTPAGASVLLNRTGVGKTPWSGERIQPGIQKIKLMLEGFGDVQRSVTTTAGGHDSVSVALIPRAVIDSTRAVRRNQIQFLRRTGFGSLALGCAAYGIWIDRRAGRHIDEENAALHAYQSLGTGTTSEQFDANWNAYQTASKDTDQLLFRRNALYVLSGIFAAGLAVSIPF